MAKETDESTIHKNMYARIYSLLFFIMAPLSLFLFLFSDALVRVILTEKWVGAIPIMKLYFLAGFVVVLVSFNSSAILSANHPKLYLKMDLIHKILMGVSLLITFSISIQAIIIGWLIVNYFYFIISERIMYQLKYYEKGKYLKMLNILVCLVPAVLCYLVTNYLITVPLLLLMINIILQPVIYFVSMKISGFRIYGEFTGILKPMLPKRIQFIL
jgi:O-antigen/teichoic acid export membrane protein